MNRRAFENRFLAISGIAFGLLLAMCVLAMKGGSHAPEAAEIDGGGFFQTRWATGQMLSECDGAIQSVVLQYTSGSNFTIPIYQQLISHLPGDVIVYVVCPTDAEAELRTALGPQANRITVIPVNHPMTAWSRDRWVALQPYHRGGGVTLLESVAENGSGIWPARKGDEQIADDISRALPNRVITDRPGLYFDGGDLLADSGTVFVAPGAIRRNLQHTALDEKDLKHQFASWLGLNPILLDNAPDHHVGMYLMAAGNHRVVVGSPALAKSLLAPIELPGGADFSPEMQARFDSVADAASKAGYTVTRIPCVSAGDGKTYITYLNGIIDQRDGHRTIYLPQYQGQDALNRAGEAVWKGLGYTTVPIDVTSAFRYFGTLHCLVNVLQKTE